MTLTADWVGQRRTSKALSFFLSVHRTFIICILCIQVVSTTTSCFIVPAALVFQAKEAIMALWGQIEWGSYLGRIMFDILYHYQLPPILPPFPPGVISLPCWCATKRNEFFIPPYLQPTPPLNLSCRTRGRKGGTKKKKKKRLKKGRWLMSHVTANKMANII